MTPRINQFSLHDAPLRRRAQRLVLAGLMTLPSSAGLGVEIIGEPAFDRAAVVVTDDSVLVETRQGEPLGAEDAAELEPISDISEFEPELAEPATQDALPNEVAPAATAEPSRVATSVSEADQGSADVARAYARDEKPQPAKFHGVTPGVSTRADLIAKWGEPDRVGQADGDTLGGDVLEFDLEPFKRVEALVEADQVTVVRVTLSEDATVDELATRLKLQEIDPVDVTDPQTNELLAVAFPEKGLTLLVKPAAAAAPESGSAGVSHLVLEPIDARAFVLRAERRSPQALKGKLRDLRLAIGADPSDAHARWLQAVTYLDAGQADAAEGAATEAVEIAAENPAYRLTLAAALAEGSEYDRAVLETRRVLDDQSAPEIVRAEALVLMGRLAALGDAKIASKAIDFQNAAIEIADRLATSTDDRERRLAKGVLVSAHLEVAREIARRDYADKAETVAQWIGRASGFAEEWIESDDGGLESRLQVARGALAALAEMRPTKDPAPWLAEAQETADQLLAECEDPLFRARVHWELGEAHLYAVRIEHLRGDAPQALGFGATAIQELASGAEPRTTSPAAERVVGQLYFYLGAVNAVHKQDHPEAVGWYDKGREILATTGAGSEFVVPRREGEELVSMGVSYWNEGQRELAVELTESGARLMERCVTAGVSPEQTLTVPYGNLQTMYKALEDASKASEYARLARGVRPVTPVAKAAPPAKAKTAPSTKPKAVANTTPAKQRQPQSQAKREPTTPPNPTPKVSLGRPTARRTLFR